LLFLALLLTAVYGYWYLTNGSRIRSQAKKYLHDITGARVSIDRASFSLFGDIRLEGVRIDVPGEGGAEPFFRAGSVILKHRPWSVFFGGSIKPTEVVPLDAEVFESPATRAFMRARSPRGPGGTGPVDLPVIRVDSCRFRRIEVVGGIPVPEKQFDLGVDMIPKEGDLIYDVYVAERKDERVAQKYHIEVQLSPGFKVTIITGAGDLVATTDALPPELRDWLERYNIEGRYSFEGPISVSEHAVEGVLKLKLDDVAFKLPEDQGGLSLTNVSGTLILTPPDESRKDALKNGRIELKPDVTGKVVEAGGATVNLSGEYLGYRLDSPFSVKIDIDKMAIPDSNPHPGLSKLLKRIKRDYSPVGRARMTVNISRASGQKDVSVSGTIWPLKMSGTHRLVPYRLDEVTGEIHFTNEKVIVKDVTGKREGGTFIINATTPLKRNAETGRWDWSARIDVDRAQMTPAVRKALPERAFVGKPYPLRNISGTIHAENGRVWVEQDFPLRTTGRGEMRCNALYGQIEWTPKGALVDIYIKADDVPIDEALIDSLSPAGRDAMGRLNADGSVKKLYVEIHDKPNEKPTYKILAGLDDVSVTYEGLPYKVSGISGDVTVNQRFIKLENLAGRHITTPVTINGVLVPGGKEVGVGLDITAKDLVVDKELYRALPAGVKKTWDSLDPSGLADISLSINQGLPEFVAKLWPEEEPKPVDNPKSVDTPKSADRPAFLAKRGYRLEISPKGMKATYKDFPYPFGGITGLVIAEPDVIKLQQLKCDRGYRLDGSILDKGRRLKLKINARGVPLDKKLLAAMPDEFNAMMSAVKTGGMLDINLSDLTIVRAENVLPTTVPATASLTTRPAVKGGSAAISWRAEGDLGLYNTTVDVAFGPKRLNGAMKGWVESSSRGLAINVRSDLRKIMVGNHEITDVKGRVTKKPGSPLVRIEDLEARVYGGRLAGREVMIRLSDPVKYAFRLFYQDVSLSDLVNAGVRDPRLGKGVKGDLEGKISMEAVAGDPKSRKAAGTVTITKGKMYKMPIMLGLMHVLYLSLPGDAAFTEGHLKYLVQSDTMVIEEIFLTGSALSLVGSGKITLSNEELDLTFLTGPPGRMPRIAVIGDASKVLNAILKELLVIRVKGSLSKPIRKAVPLRSMDAILKELLSPGRVKK
jgi:hypothetical protein